MAISKQDAEWLLGEYNSKRGYGRVNDWIDYHLRAISIIRGQQVGKPSCSCEFGSFARIANSLYEQHLAEIQAAANPIIEEPVIKKTRGRQKTGL